MMNKMLIGMMVAGLMVSFGKDAYNMFRPIETVAQSHVVVAGDTWYGLCDKYYVVKDNAECFEENWHRNKVGKGTLQIGDVVTITNRVYK